MVKHFRNLLLFPDAEHTCVRMANLPQVLASGRMPRVHLASPVPAVLRCQDGSHLPGDLEVVSLAGGLLHLPQHLHPNTCASLMFLGGGGPVLAKAEMLSPLSRTQQGFRFIALDHKDQQNLLLWIQSSLKSQSCDEDWWISKYRAAVSRRPAPRRAAWKIGLVSVVFGMLILSAVYFVHFQLLK